LSPAYLCTELHVRNDRHGRQLSLNQNRGVNRPGESAPNADLGRLGDVLTRLDGQAQTSRFGAHVVVVWVGEQFPFARLSAKLGHHGWAVFSRLFHDRLWWEPVPVGLDLRPRAELAAKPPGPSRIFAIHPGWQAWRPSPSTVH
jgi:hypothetical protein